MKRLSIKLLGNAPRIPVLSVIGATVLMLASCHPLARLQQPAAALPPTYGSATTDTVIFSSSEWDTMFTDTTLRTMIGKALVHNKEILKASARLEEVRELYGIANANYLPSLDASAEIHRETSWFHDGHNTADKPSPDPQGGIKVHIGWEYNLLGKLNYARREAAADYRATAEDLRAIRLSIVTQVATTYYNLLAQECVLEITRNTLATREESMKKARLRFESGLTSELIYLQAQTEYLSTLSSIPDLEKNAETSRTALHILMGEYPTDSIGELRHRLIAQSPPALPTGVPSELLRRRPDLLASSHRLEAAAQEVGVKFADRFPSLRLDFTFGFWNRQFPDLFKSLYYYPAGTIAGTVFDFGRKKRAHKAAIQRYEQARLQYEQDILNAFGEVRNAALSYSGAHRTTASKRVYLATAQNYLKLADLQYHAGTLSYLDVLDAQRQLFDAQIGLSNALRDEYVACINLYKALGGGFIYKRQGNEN